MEWNGMAWHGMVWYVCMYVYIYTCIHAHDGQADTRIDRYIEFIE